MAPFSKEDKVSIESLYKQKRYNVRQFRTEFPELWPQMYCHFFESQCMLFKARVRLITKHRALGYTDTSYTLVTVASLPLLWNVHQYDVINTPMRYSTSRPETRDGILVYDNVVLRTSGRDWTCWMTWCTGQRALFSRLCPAWKQMNTKYDALPTRWLWWHNGAVNLAYKRTNMFTVRKPRTAKSAELLACHLLCLSASS